MIRTILIAIGLVMATQTASAAKISPRDRTGVELSKAWMTEDIKPRRSADGSVVFQYGATLPTVVCAPLRVCDIALQPGEKVISSPKLGDTVRWKLAPAKSGPEGAEIIHAVVKPTEPGLDTTLMIPTDRRMYHLRLVSTKTDWMPFISFEYPEDHEKAWAEIQVAQAEQQRRESMRKLEVGASRMPVEDLNFEYEIDGESHWRPVRVFDDGSHTYIDLPHKAKHRDAPILLVNDAEQDRLVNYRMHGSRFIVDTLFDQAKLISGVGDNQQKVVIRRAGQ
ncbi:P-type conjugative transfer protein TrbG [Sedimenticola thiotaurini]|uniref:P-type conjugative transfer protein TrbG n=1 Tax=Sedimenticola thiotaurini TaxID=1543721 RepID=A0A0F7K1H5_9GAMM|nr:P-type conjugative transfer protein TrbG [Sedimenticola thiotaurini]AKH22406.1 hypothetical protein AAY24_18275 [Sedimenticola thiotaurini]